MASVEGLTIAQRLAAKIEDIEADTDEYLVSASKVPQAEYDYRREQATVAFRMKAEGMAATFINKVLNGVESVSLKRLERDSAQAAADVARERLNADKMIARILNDQAAREYGRPSNA